MRWALAGILLWSMFSTQTGLALSSQETQSSRSMEVAPENEQRTVQAGRVKERNAVSHPPDLAADIPWPESAGMSGVASVQAAFNHARAQENNQLGSSLPALSLPNQTTWNAMSDGEKALWLINRERSDRGVMPLQGLEANVSGVAQYYADYLLDHNAWGHTEDGRSPWERLEDNSAIGACHDFLPIGENLAVFVTSSSSIPLPIERSIYMWMYEDVGSGWGHRHAILWYPYNDNNGTPGSEGFLGIGRANGGPYRGPFSQSWNFTEMIVMNVFDPCASWSDEPPTVTSLTLLDLNPTNAATVRFRVMFSKSVTGVDGSNFTLSVTGISGASVTNVSGSGSSRTVTVNTGTNDGTIQLNVVDNDSITDLAGNLLGGSGANNGSFSGGETYNVIRTVFVDVPPTHPFRSYIEAFYDAGITGGCSSSPRLYCPDGIVTRGQMAVFLERALGNLSPSPSSGGIFTDISADDPFKPFIEELYNDGITGGCSTSPLMYCPLASVTRAQMAVFIERALGNYSPSPNPTSMFNDVSMDDPFKLFIEELYNDGITTGCSSNPLSYCPNQPVTRGQMAVFLVKAFGISLP